MVIKQQTLFTRFYNQARRGVFRRNDVLLRGAPAKGKKGIVMAKANHSQLEEQQVMFEKPGPVKNGRLKLTQRADVSAMPGFGLTERDRTILESVYEFRALTTDQIEKLLFQPDRGQDHPTKTTRCQLRLKLLYHSGYLFRDEQPQKLSEGRKPLVYFLDQKGAELVSQSLGIPVENLDWDRRDNRLSTLFLDHLLAINDVRVAITVSANANDFEIEDWLDDKSLKRSQMRDYVTLKGTGGAEERAAVVPDGYFRLHAGEYVYHHFLEVDRRTVTGEASDWGRRDWARKVRAYLEYYRSGLYEKRYETQGLRILTVTTGERRLANLREITEKAGGKARFWFTTFDQVSAASVLTSPIWQVASKDGLHSLTW